MNNIAPSNNIFNNIAPSFLDVLLIHNDRISMNFVIGTTNSTIIHFYLLEKKQFDKTNPINIFQKTNEKYFILLPGVQRLKIVRDKRSQLCCKSCSYSGCLQFCPLTFHVGPTSLEKNEKTPNFHTCMSTFSILGSR